MDLTSWRGRARALLREVFSDHVTMVAAGLAFFGATSLVPAIAAAVALYGLVAGTDSVDAQLRGLEGFLPRDALDLLARALMSVASSFGLGLGFAMSLLLVLWTSQRAASGLISALNIVFDQPERRGFWRRQAVALGIAGGGILVLLLSLSAIAIVPMVLSPLGRDAQTDIGKLLRWPLLAIFLLVALSLLFSYGPSRVEARFRWISWGSIAGAVLWISASFGFSAYLRHLGSFGRLYGSMGAVIVLLIWLYIGALSVLIGAEIDALAESRAKGRSSTSDPKRALGERERRD